MTNWNTVDNFHPTEEYMGNYGWYPIEDGYHHSDMTTEGGDGVEEYHSIGIPSHNVIFRNPNPTVAIITEHGIFCSKSCAESARKEFIYRNALDDRESWYWEGIEYGEKK